MPSTGCRRAGQRQRRFGPAWTSAGRSAAGFFTRRTAEAALRALLDDERERWVPGPRLADVTFAEAASEWLRYVEHDRACKATAATAGSPLTAATSVPSG